MSKAPKKPDAKKSKDVKGKTVSAEKQQNTTYLEIVPGKFNENDWNNLLEIDESQEFIWELLDECVENANKIIYSNYLDSQTIPFTINEAKNAILHLIDWQFLDDDDDDDLTENWVQDTEPEACMIDSWAQGYVQTVVVDQDLENHMVQELDEQKSSVGFLEELTQVPYEEAQAVETLDEMGMIRHGQFQLFDPLSTEPKVKPDTVNDAKKKLFKSKKFSNPLSFTQTEVTLSPKGNSMYSFEEKKKTPVHTKVKQVDTEVKRIEESIVKAPNAAQSLLKTLLTRPAGQREVELNEFGDIVSMTKLDFDKTHSIGLKTRFSVNDNSKAEAALELNSRRSKIEKYENSVTNKSSQARDKKKNSPRKPKIADSFEEEDLILDPVPGVVFSMLNSVRVGPKKTLVPNKQQTLYDKSEIFLKPIRPLERSDVFTRMSLEEILESSHEVTTFKTGNKLKPIPPITQFGIQQR